jgi:death on curing protein
MALAFHAEQIREHGGTPGVRDPGLLESALGRPINRHGYSPDISIEELAAAYAFGIAKNHPFVDGNKRTAFTVAYTFLGLNGYDLNVEEPEVVRAVEDLTASRITEDEFAAWLRQGLARG